MFKALFELFELLNKDEQRRFLVLQVLVVFMALLEVLSVMAVGPFMSLVADPSVIDDSQILAWFYQLTNAKSTNQYLLYVGAVVILTITVASLVSMLTVHRLSRFGAKTGMDLGTRLFQYYLAKPWLFHASGNSSKQINNIVNEAARISSGVINPFLQLNAKAVLAAVLAISIFIYDPLVAIVGVSFFSCAYLAMFALIKARLSRYSETISRTSEFRMQLLNEAFGAIKDVLLRDKQHHFSRHFSMQSDQLARSLSNTQILSQLPRYVMEFVALSTVIVLIQVLLFKESNNLSAVLPTLAIYALGGLKLLPAFQQIYTSSSYIRGNISALKNLQQDLEESLGIGDLSNSPEYAAELSFNDRIVLSDIEFCYQGQKNPALQAVSFEIHQNEFIGIAGPSGGGKSTLADVLLGLIPPDRGQVSIGSRVVDNTAREWRSRVAYVPQDIVLLDTSIAKNVAFGCDHDEIDLARVSSALALACLDDYVSALPLGINAEVGERGVQMSGGQRQRIGIARALYHDFDMIIMDEATSALDGPTEQSLVKTLMAMKGKKTIVMIAHRLSTLEQCDSVLFMDKGLVADQGTFEALSLRHPDFFQRGTVAEASK